MLLFSVGALGFQQAFFRSLALVSAAELFDKTWCIGLILALKFKPVLVFAGSFAALLLHSVLAAGFGAAVARFIAPHWLLFIAAGLMLVFALISFWEWYVADPDSEAIDCAASREEASEDEAVVDAEGGTSPGAGAGGDHRSSPSADALLQACGGKPAVTEGPTTYGATEAERVPASDSRGGPRGGSEGVVLAKAFGAVFVAEWGDRTQFVMVGQHASQPLVPTFLGCSAAFFLASLSAVALGSLLASYRIKERFIHAVTAVVFLLFAILTFQDGLTATAADRAQGTGMTVG
jgi:putative Ca2+/H+ antiporter (TMEM165/GDT1 family)